MLILLPHEKAMVCPNKGEGVSNCEQFSGNQLATIRWFGVNMSQAADSELRGRVILCIDDNHDVLECEKIFLESFGFTVLTASSGHRGLELALVHSIDVVVVDYLMPGMNGHEFAIEMRRVMPQTPIIMLSADVDVPDRVLKWVDLFIPKDRLPSHLLPAIAQLHGHGWMPPTAYDA